MTVKHLRGAIGLMSFISEFCPFSAMILDPIRKIATGNSSDIVKWDDQSKKAFKVAIEAQNKLMAKSPIRDDLGLIMTVDTSYAGTGAVLYQYDEKKKERYFIGFFQKNELRE